jgi:rhomboid protease GluP
MGSQPPAFSIQRQDQIPAAAEAAAEYLPPDSPNGPGDASSRPSGRRRPLWAAAPATYTLVGINCGVFLAMLAHHISFWMPTVDQLMVWGADRPNNVLVYGEWWRIVTAMFVHVGILHLATNMWCLWNLGLLAEPLMGSFGVLAAYILTGAAGDLLSTCYNWIRPLRDSSGAPFFQAGAGASGAVFGIAGALIILLKSKVLLARVPVDELKRLRKSVIYFAAINLVIGISINLGSNYTGISIDNSAHIGGFASGLLFAAPLVPRIGSPRSVFQTRLRLAVGLMIGLLVLFGFYVAHVPPPQG